MAAFLSGKVDNARQNTVVLVSGGNIDPTCLARLMQDLRSTQPGGWVNATVCPSKACARAARLVRSPAQRRKGPRQFSSPRDMLPFWGADYLLGKEGIPRSVWNDFYWL